MVLGHIITIISQTLVKSDKMELGPEIRESKLSCEVITIVTLGQYMGLQGNEKKESVLDIQQLN